MSSMTGRPDLLATIVAATRRRVEASQAREPFGEVVKRSLARSRKPALGFREALARPGGVNVIAECKRRSPSRGVLCDQYDPGAIAAAYERGGAAAVSVLTEPTFFDGSLEHLADVTARVRVPVLRKDFTVDEYQIVEARAAGADAILLVVAALDDDALRGLHAAARGRHLDVLVEVHDADELDRALTIGAEIIGVNNRNLRTLEVDTAVSGGLIDRIPEGVTAVSESGFRSPEELAALRRAGYHAFLVGERLMASDDPEAALETLLGPGH